MVIFRELFLKFTVIVAVVLLVSFVLLCLISFSFVNGEVFETDLLSDYGNIVGNYDNSYPEEFIFSFFPKELDASYSDITYHYYAQKGPAYAFECYLEFTVENPIEYEALKNELVNGENLIDFMYDTSYIEYSVGNMLAINIAGSERISISSALIGKVLFSNEKQSFIFTALGVRDGAIDATHLNHFFERYDIDIVDYQNSAYLTYKDELNGIPYEERFSESTPTSAPVPGVSN